MSFLKHFRRIAKAIEDAAAGMTPREHSDIADYVREGRILPHPRRRPTGHADIPETAENLIAAAELNEAASQMLLARALRNRARAAELERGK